MLARLLKSDSIRSAIGFGVGGIGYALANILLAKELPAEGFGVLTLALAMGQFGLTLGPFGLEIVANRHRPRANPAFASLVLGLAALTGLFIAAIASIYYALSAITVALVFALVVGTATNRVGAALFQAERRIPLAMALLQIHNFVLLGIAVWMFALPRATEVFVLGIVTGVYLLSAIAGWWLATRTLNPGRRSIDLKMALREGIAAMGTGVAVQLLMQFERLAIPKLGTLEMLSTFAVLAATIGSPFRMLQIGTSFSLLPRLRAAATAAEARAVLVRESATSLAVALVAAAVIALASPLVFDTLLAGKYPVDSSLIYLSILVGMAKLWEGFSTTVVSACGSARSMTQIGVLAWVCLAIGTAATVLASGGGLFGILCGVGSAWVLFAAGGTWLAVISFRRRFNPAGAGEHRTLEER